jgi:non-homologous end joining protein Ku
MRNKQYRAAIRPHGDVLVLEKMYVADEVRDPADEIGQLPAKPSLRKKDVDMAVNFIESMTTALEPENYRDTYTERVEHVVEAKKTNEEIVTEARTGTKGIKAAVHRCGTARRSCTTPRSIRGSRRRVSIDASPSVTTTCGADGTHL